MIWDNFSIFRTNCAIAWGTRAYNVARIFAGVAQGKWLPKFPKSFMFLAHNSTPLWLLEFCLSIFAVSCSSLSEDSAEFRYVPLYIADQIEFRCSFYKNFILLRSKFQIWRRLTAFIIQLSYTVWIPIIWLVDLYHVPLGYDGTNSLTSLSWCNSGGLNSTHHCHYTMASADSKFDDSCLQCIQFE